MEDLLKSIAAEGEDQIDMGLALSILKDLCARPQELLHDLGATNLKTRSAVEGKDRGAVSFCYPPTIFTNFTARMEIVKLDGYRKRLVRWYDENGTLAVESSPCESWELEDIWWEHIGYEPPCDYARLRHCIVKPGEIIPDPDVKEELSDWQIYYVTKRHLTG